MEVTEFAGSPAKAALYKSHNTLLGDGLRTSWSGSLGRTREGRSVLHGYRQALVRSTFNKGSDDVTHGDIGIRPSDHR